MTDGPATKVAPRTTAAATATNAATANTSIPDGTPLEPSAGGHSGTASPSVESQGDGRTYVEKRRAHNAVERRYRNSINDRITELRSNLPLNWITGPKAKVGKGYTGKRSVTDHGSHSQTASSLFPRPEQTCGQESYFKPPDLIAKLLLSFFFFF